MHEKYCISLILTYGHVELVCVRAGPLPAIAQLGLAGPREREKESTIN